MLGSAVNVSWELNSPIPVERLVIHRLVGEYRVPQLLADAEVSVRGTTYSFSDAQGSPGTRCAYRVSVLQDGTPLTLLETKAVTIPAVVFSLEQNSPNPFNPVTEIFIQAAPDRVRHARCLRRGRLPRQSDRRRGAVGGSAEREMVWGGSIGQARRQRHLLLSADHGNIRRDEEDVVDQIVRVPPRIHEDRPPDLDRTGGRFRQMPQGAAATRILRERGLLLPRPRSASVDFVGRLGRAGARRVGCAAAATGVDGFVPVVVA